jgi:RNA polymerase sigma-B factor
MERTGPERQLPKDGSVTARLLRAYHERGDTSARQRLVELYLPLVEMLARRHARAAGEYDDLYQVGCIGLINAIDRFELARGNELAAFAVPTIAGEIQRYQRDRGGSVRMPRRVSELRGPARRVHAALAAKLGRDPTPAQVAQALGADERDVAVALDGRAATARELADGDATSVEEPDAADERLFLSEAFRGLDARERQILYLRYVRDLEAGEVARQLGLSPRQLSRATNAALAKLRGELEGPRRPASAPRAREPARDDGDGAPSGRAFLRLPRSLHADLAQAARRDDLSLNRFIVSALSKAVEPPPARRRSPFARGNPD